MKKPFIALCLCISLFSCEKKVSNGFPEILFDELEYKFNLPDTLIANKLYSATIEFKSDFDKIIDPLQVGGLVLKDSIKSRLVYFYQFQHIKSPMKSNEDLILKDSAFVLNKKFDIDSIVFKETGEFVFCGLIKDEIMYNHYNSKGIRDSVHFDRRMQQIFKKVVVVE